MLASILADVFVFVSALLHALFFNIEALTWFRGSAKSFGVKPEAFQVTATLAANQGFYNLILTAGLLTSLYTNTFSHKVWFSTAVLCCGVIGFLTTGSAKILQAQCGPAALALVFLFIAQEETEIMAAILVIGSVAATFALSKFVKARVDGDAAVHAKKLAAAK